MSEANVDQATSTGALEMPAEPDTSAHSISAGILADLGNEPLIPPKTKAKKTKKPVAEVTDEDDDSAPPEHLLPKDEEPEADETEETEATEGDDETEEPTTLDDQLAALAQNYGVDPELLSGAESIGEAERLVSKMMAMFYREGAAQAMPNGNVEQQQSIPAAPAVQKPAADALEIDLSKYDDDEPIKADLQKIIDRDKRRESELAELKAEKARNQEAEFNRVQQHVATQFQQEFFQLAPELFGTTEKQDPVQAKRMREAFAMADTLIRGYAASGQPLPAIKAIADWSVKSKFSDELSKRKQTTKRAAVEARMPRRSVGQPARVSRNLSGTPKGAIHEGPLNEDPDILSAVKGVLTRTRG